MYAWVAKLFNPPPEVKPPPDPSDMLIAAAAVGDLTLLLETSSKFPFPTKRFLSKRQHESALFTSVLYKRYEIVRALVQMGVDPHCNGERCFREAMVYGDDDMISALNTPTIPSPSPPPSPRRKMHVRK